MKKIIVLICCVLMLWETKGQNDGLNPTTNLKKGSIEEKEVLITEDNAASNIKGRFVNKNIKNAGLVSLDDMMGVLYQKNFDYNYNGFTKYGSFTSSFSGNGSGMNISGYASNFLNGLWINNANPFQNFSIQSRVKTFDGNGVSIGNGSRGGRGLFLRLVVLSGKYNLMLHRTNDGVTTEIMRTIISNDMSVGTNDEFIISLIRTERNIQGFAERVSDGKVIGLNYENTPQSGNLYYDAYGSPCLVFLGNCTVLNFKFQCNEKGSGIWLGNSIVEGYYADENRLTYRRLVGDKISGGMINAAIGSQTTTGLISSLSMYAQLKPKFALIETGVNDALAGTTAVAFMDLQKQLARGLIKNGIVPIFLIPQNWQIGGAENALLNQYRDSLLSYKTQFNIIDMQLALRDPLTNDMCNLYFSGDNHPNTLGNAVVADYLINKLRQIVPINSFNNDYLEKSNEGLNNLKERLSKYKHSGDFIKIALVGDSNFDNPFSLQGGLLKYLYDKNIKISGSGFQSVVQTRGIGQNNVTQGGTWTTKALTSGGKGMDGGEASTVQNAAYLQFGSYGGDGIGGVEVQRMAVLNIHYLRQVGGGSFDVVNMADNAVLGTINTDGASAFMVSTITLPSSNTYSIRLITKSTSIVTIYGFEMLDNGTNGVIVEKVGVSGSTSKDWYNNIVNGNFMAGLNSIAPHLVIIGLGTNDPYFSNEVEKYKTALIKMVKEIKGAGYDVLLLAPAIDDRVNPIPTQLVSYDSAVIEVSKLLKSSYLDLGKIHGSTANQVSKGIKSVSDKIHYTTYGGYVNAKMVYDLAFSDFERGDFVVGTDNKVSQSRTQLSYTSSQNDANVRIPIDDNMLWMGILTNRRAVFASTRNGISHHGANLAPYAGGVVIGSLNEAGAPLDIYGTGFGHDMINIKGSASQDNRIRFQSNDGTSRAWIGLTASTGSGFLGTQTGNSLGLRGDAGIVLGVGASWAQKINTDLSVSFANNVNITGVLTQNISASHDINIYNSTSTILDNRIGFQRSGTYKGWLGLTNTTNSMITGASQDFLALRGENGLYFAIGATWAQRINNNLSVDFANNIGVTGNLTASGTLNITGVSNLTSIAQSGNSSSSGVTTITNNSNDLITLNASIGGVDNRIRFQRGGTSNSWIGLTNSTSSMITGAVNDYLAFRGDNGIYISNGGGKGITLVGNVATFLNEPIAPSFRSNTTTGAPFIVSSSSMVTNLNSHYWRGLDTSDVPKKNAYNIFTQQNDFTGNTRFGGAGKSNIFSGTTFISGLNHTGYVDGTDGLFSRKGDSEVRSISFQDLVNANQSNDTFALTTVNPVFQISSNLVTTVDIGCYTNAIDSIDIRLASSVFSNNQSITITTDKRLLMGQGEKIKITNSAGVTQIEIVNDITGTLSKTYEINNGSLGIMNLTIQYSKKRNKWRIVAFKLWDDL